MNNIKVGDIVRMIDHSYRVDLDKGRATQFRSTGGFHSGDDLIVVAVDCILPVIYASRNELQKCTLFQEVNDVILFNLKKEMYIFAMSKLLHPAPKRCKVCGQIIEEV